jgi:hypothetical protein
VVDNQVPCKQVVQVVVEQELITLTMQVPQEILLQQLLLKEMLVALDTELKQVLVIEVVPVAAELALLVSVQLIQ